MVTWSKFLGPTRIARASLTHIESATESLEEDVSNSIVNLGQAGAREAKFDDYPQVVDVAASGTAPSNRVPGSVQYLLKNDLAKWEYEKWRIRQGFVNALRAGIEALEAQLSEGSSPQGYSREAWTEWLKEAKKVLADAEKMVDEADDDLLGFPYNVIPLTDDAKRTRSFRKKLSKFILALSEVRRLIAPYRDYLIIVGVVDRVSVPSNEELAAGMRSDDEEHRAAFEVRDNIAWAAAKLLEVSDLIRVLEEIEANYGQLEEFFETDFLLSNMKEMIDEKRALGRRIQDYIELMHEYDVTKPVRTFRARNREHYDREDIQHRLKRNRRLYNRLKERLK